MSRIINSDQRSPSISTEAFSGQPERRFGDVMFRGIFHHDKLSLAICKLNRDTLFKYRQEKTNDVPDSQNNRIENLRAGCISKCCMASTSCRRQSTLSEHGP